jgi:hypothetical protein
MTSPYTLQQQIERVQGVIFLIKATTNIPPKSPVGIFNVFPIRKIRFGSKWISVSCSFLRD